MGPFSIPTPSIRPWKGSHRVWLAIVASILLGCQATGAPVARTAEPTAIPAGADG